jgi:hypothetical protein
MSNGTIVTLKKNTTHDAEPSSSSLYQAELAINTADAKIFTKRDDGTVLSQSIGTVQSNYYEIGDNTNPRNIDSIDATLYRSAKYVIQCTHGTDFQTIELLLMHDGTNVYITRYGLMYTNDELATFTADLDGDTIFVDAVATYSNTMVKFTRTVVLA